MTTDDAKTYLSKREIPRLFESLMTGLMYHRPGDHIKYLIDCLQKVHDKGQENITWSSFVDIRRTKTPLPPISNGQVRPSSKGSSRPTSRTRTPKEAHADILDLNSLEENAINRVIFHGNNTVPSPENQGTQPGSEEDPIREKSMSPLPAIPTSKPTSSLPEKISLPDIPIVFVMGSPGSSKESQVELLLTRYAGWKHLSVGKLIKEEIKRRGDAQTKWKLTHDLLSKGEAAPEEVTIEVVMEALKDCGSAKGIVVTGFPRNMSQVSDYARAVSRVDVVFMIDCDEAKAMDKMLRKGRNSSRPEYSMSAITNKMNYFKANTLETAKYFDDQGKLVVIDGDTDEANVKFELGKKFDDMFYSQYGTTPLESKPPGTAGSIPEPPTYKKKYETEDSMVEEDEKPLFTGGVPQPPTIVEKDTGRKADLPQCPIIFVAGGPGSGKGTQCQKIIQRYPDFVHLSMGDIIRSEISTQGTADEKWGMISQLVSKGEMAPEDVTVDLLKEQLKKHSSAKAFVIEGFPRDKNQVEAFNKCIGGLNFVILFDCEEYYMQTRLLKRGRESGRIDDNPSAIANRLNFYKYNTLPVLKHFDDNGKLVVLDADRDTDAMFYDISQMFDFAFFGRKPGDQISPSQSSSVTYMTEVQQGANRTNDSDISPAMLIKAGFEANLTRQRKVLKRGASYTRKYDTVNDAKSDKTSTASKDVDKDSTDAKDQIQAAFTAKKTRDEVKAKKEQDLARAQISASFQGHKVRQNVKKSEKDKEEEAADRIMAGFQGYKAREQYKSRLQQIEKVKEEEKADDADEKIVGDEELAEAALRIQAGFRGYKARQDIEKLMEPEQPSLNDEEANLAACRIQAGFQGYKTRKQLKEQKVGKKEDAEAVPVQDEVVEETITAEGASTTGNNIENPAHTKALEETAQQ